MKVKKMKCKYMYKRIILPYTKYRAINEIQQDNLMDLCVILRFYGFHQICKLHET